MNLRYEMYEFITENTISYIHLSKHYGRNEIVCICYEFDYSRNKKIHYRRCEFIPSERSDFGMGGLPQPARADLLAPDGGACNTRNTRETVVAGASFVILLLYIACSQDKGRI